MQTRNVFRFLALCSVLLFSSLSHSALIESRGYTLDTSTNIITGDTLEWLNWNETLEMSVAQVYKNAKFDGWRLATSAEMFGLLDTFFGPNLDVDMTSTRRERVNGVYGTQFGEDFFSLFTGFIDNHCGNPHRGPICIDNPQNRTLTIFGSPNGFLKNLFIRDEYVWQSNPALGPVNVNGYLEVNNGPAQLTGSLYNTGIALVRGVADSKAAVEVNAPISTLLLILPSLIICLRNKQG